jgi:hypothetical protein
MRRVLSKEASPHRYRYGAVFEQEFATHLNGMEDAIHTVAECLCPAQGRFSITGEAASPDVSFRDFMAGSRCD